VVVAQLPLNIWLLLAVGVVDLAQTMALELAALAGY
jgi:hypothetical protein